ncbi:MAG: hypothetical protein HY520_01505 [Candidatus Aenigmarchaeota archaeon]|nr:hypothetical protein [Candidatus Aenigmarchaeota archaeon]
MMPMHRKPIFALALLVGAIAVVSGCTSAPAVDYSAFTACVKDAGVVEYGAYWCPNCARVKLTLGDAWNSLAYVECDPKCVDTGAGLPDYCKGFTSQTAQCLEMGVDKYPTWTKDRQILYVGTDLGEVARVSGCPLPD